MRLRVVLADDDPAFLEKFTSVLAGEFDIVATATDGKSALDAVLRVHPDVVVVDLGMPVLNGIQVANELRRSRASSAIVVCSVETDLEIVEAALQAGALGYVFKSRVEKDLVAAVHAAACGTSFVSPA